METLRDPRRGGGDNDVTPSNDEAGDAALMILRDSGGGVEGAVKRKLGSFCTQIIGSPIGVDGTEYGLIVEGTGEGCGGMSACGGCAGALFRRRRTFMDAAREVGGGSSCTSGVGGNGPLGGG